MNRGLWYEDRVPRRQRVSSLGGVARAPPPANAENKLECSVEKNRDP